MKTKRFHQRSWIDIIACILEDYNESSGRRGVYRCNLSLSQLNLYEDYLVEAGFLKVSRRENGVKVFETTQKGKEFLRDYRKIRASLDKMSF